jgi:hypothetical protein
MGVDWLKQEWCPMRITDNDDRPSLGSGNIEDSSTVESVKAMPEPTHAAVAEQNAAHAQQSQKTQVVDPASGKGAIVNDMA